MYQQVLTLIPQNVREWVESYITTQTRGNETTSLRHMIHNTLCLLVADRYVFPSTEDAIYINLEMTERGTAIGLLKKYYDKDYSVNYIPDIIRVSRGEDDAHLSFPLISHERISLHPIIDKPSPSAIFDVTISINPMAAFQNKLHLHHKVLPLVFGFDGKLKTNRDFLIQEQINHCEEFLAQCFNSMSVEEKNLFSSDNEELLEPLFLSTPIQGVPRKLQFTDREQHPARYEIKRIQKFQEIHTEESTEEACYRGLIFTSHTFGTSSDKESELDRFIEVLEDIESVQVPRMKELFSMNVSTIVKDVKEGKQNSDLDRIFRLGFRSKHRVPVPPLVASKAQKSPKRKPTWMSSYFNLLNEYYSKSFTIESLAQYNDVDKLCNIVVEEVWKPCSRTKGGRLLSMVTNVSNTLSSLATMKRNNCIWFPIEVYENGKPMIVGFGIRGPSHMRTENQRVQLLYFVIHKSSDLNSFTKPLEQLRKYWIWKVKGTDLVVTCHLTDTWPLKMYAEQNGLSCLITPCNWVTDLADDSLDLRMEQKDKIVSIVASKREEVVHIFVLQVLFLCFQNPELDGFLADFRKVLLPLARFAEKGAQGRCYMMGKGDKLIKVLGGVKSNPIVLQIIDEFNGSDRE